MKACMEVINRDNKKSPSEDATFEGFRHILRNYPAVQEDLHMQSVMGGIWDKRHLM